MSRYDGAVENVQLFVVSSKLYTAATGLQKWVDGEKLFAEDKQTLAWAGELWGLLDLGSEHCKDEKYSVSATTLRPLFYRSIVNQKIPFTSDLSNRVYETLRSNYCENITLQPQELLLIQKMFNGIADDALNQLEYVRRAELEYED